MKEEEDAFDRAVFESPQWYTKALKYWSEQAPTLDGVLGGYGNLTSCDVKESDAFLREHWIAEGEEIAGRALDVGAGVGRVTEELLLQSFESVDLLEPIAHFLDAARVRLRAVCAKRASFRRAPERRRYVDFIAEPAQEFTPREMYYDCIWIQWMSGHLTDTDLVSFLTKSSRGLTRDRGRIFVKENTSKGSAVYDGDDSSVTRTRAEFERIFERAHLRIITSRRQVDFPSYLFTVRMWILAPLASSTESPAAPVQETNASVQPAEEGEIKEETDARIL